MSGEPKIIDNLRDTPLSWLELKPIILSADPGEIQKLARSPEVCGAYRAFRERNNCEWASIYDYLLCDKFGFEWAWEDDCQVETGVVGGDGRSSDARDVRRRKKRSMPTFREYLSDQRTREMEGKLKLCVNDFPYYYSPGVQHWILWKLGGMITSDEIANAKSEILRESGRREEEGSALSDHEIFLHWVNPPHLKSLPGIDHVHILFNGLP
ncbi:hypothetical protein ACHAXA_000710 [Cyclostephanos tholiformis]|uniref:Uncharacterized protein n=1 Tax=Cyclostephanos tholiformis TaxID=382380 RepID=A0ABD3RRG1_9STRA